jgi:hypothetical protein
MNHLVDVTRHVSQLKLETDAGPFRRECLEERCAGATTWRPIQGSAFDARLLGV